MNETDWKVETIERIRRLIQQADPDSTEEIKWRKPSNDMKGVPTWSHNGHICTAETYKDKVKLTFARGAALPDPAGIFNGKDNGHTRRSIDITKQSILDETAFIHVIRNAAHYNGQKK